jgi:hypothetical protein
MLHDRDAKALSDRGTRQSPDRGGRDGDKSAESKDRSAGRTEALTTAPKSASRKFYLCQPLRGLRELRASLSASWNTAQRAPKCGRATSDLSLTNLLENENEDEHDLSKAQHLTCP